MSRKIQPGHSNKDRYCILRNNITSKYAHRTTLQNTQLLCFKVNVGTVMLIKQPGTVMTQYSETVSVM